MTGLEPFEGTFEFQQASHLLRRTMFGPTYAQIKEAETKGLDATIEKLFEVLPLPEPPVNPNFEDDPFVPIGETWIHAPYANNSNIGVYRAHSLQSWIINVLIEEKVSIREKLVLFWHNHYATTNMSDPRLSYRYINLLRENSFGSFKELTKKITIDPDMLRFLNGAENIATAPNDNYARELLELFTLGRGEAVALGDYTNYTEQDIIEVARMLTGWEIVGLYAQNPNIEVAAIFNPDHHDQGEKQLSHRFDNQIITNQGSEEYSFLIDLIFEKEEVAKFICRKLYRWFVFYQINETVEFEIITPMAQILRDNNYLVQPALEALFRSAHFYDATNLGVVIKNPIDYGLSIIKPFNIKLPEDLPSSYATLLFVYIGLSELNMQYFQPPSVAGWKAYYQAPSYYRTWIDSATLQSRQQMNDVLNGGTINGTPSILSLSPLDFIETIDNPFDPNSVIEEFSKILFPKPITEIQKDYLKEILIPGLPDFEWTVEFTDYYNDPTNENLAIAVENKLRNLIRAMLNMPEFQLS